MDNIFAPTLSPSSRSTTEEHVKYVHGRGEAMAMAAATTFLQSLLTTFVIDFALVWIREYFIGLRDGFELEKVSKRNG